MDSFSYHAKFNLRKMKVVKHKNCIVCLVSKSAKKIDYLKYIAACLCSSTTEILNISYQSIYFMDSFSF